MFFFLFFFFVFFCLCFFRVLVAALPSSLKRFVSYHSRCFILFYLFDLYLFVSMSAQLCDVYLVCSNIVRNHHKNTQCNSCDGYVHKKCTNIKPKKQIGLNSSEWTCPPCYKRNTKNTDSSTDDTSRYKSNCVMCSKNIKECHKDISCKTCKGYVHKKCTKLKQKQLKSMDRNE